MSNVPVFDIGDTLSYSIPLIKDTVETFLEEHGVKDIPEFPIRQVDQYDPNSLNTWLEDNGLECDSQELCNRIKESKKEALLKSGSLEVLKELGDKGHVPGIISDNSIAAKKLHEEIFDSAEVEIDGFVVSEEVGTKKPDEKIFQAFLELRGVKGSDCVYFGNDTSRDRGCVELDMDFVLVEGYQVFGNEEWDGNRLQKLNVEEVMNFVS